MRNKQIVAVLSIIAMLALIAFCLAYVAPPGPGPIALGLQSYTNNSAVVGITNRSRIHQFDYFAIVQRKTASEWPGGSPVGIITSSHQSGVLGPGQFTNLTLRVMTYAPPCPWRVSVFCNPPRVMPNSLRFRAGLFALRLGAPKFAQKLFGGDFQQIQLSTAEMQQWEK